MSEPQTQQAAPGKAALEKILGPTLAAQCLLDPEPGDLRGHVLAELNVWVPPGHKVGEWLLQNRKEPQPPARPRRIEVECTEDGTESGTARYTARYTASGTISIQEEDLADLIREAGSRGEAVEKFKEWARNNHNVDDYERSDYSYSDEESDDEESDDRGSNAAEVIEAYLDEHPELLAEVAEEEERHDD